MKTFLKNVSIFLLTPFLIALLLQIIISIRINGKSLTGYDNLEQTSDVNADLVFIGSSRCWVHFDPAFFDSTFKIKSVNIGVDGHSEMAMIMTRLKYYLSVNKPPKYAILNFDPFVNNNKNINYVHKDDFARYSFFPTRKNLVILNYFKFNFIEKYVPMYSILRYGLLQDCILLKNNSTYMQYGYQRNDTHWDIITNPVSDKMKSYFFNKKEIPEITKSLRDISLLCSKNKIRLLCIQTPVYKILNDSIFAIPGQICRNLKIPFVDANKTYISNEINYFYNSFHMNKAGVDEMNSFLKNDSVLVSFLQNKN